MSSSLTSYEDMEPVRLFELMGTISGAWPAFVMLFVMLFPRPTSRTHILSSVRRSLRRDPPVPVAAGSSGGSLGEVSLEDIPWEKPSLERRVLDMETELVRLRKRSTGHSNTITTTTIATRDVFDSTAIVAPAKLVKYDPVAVKEPRTLHSWEWLRNGKYGFTRWFMLPDLFEVSYLPHQRAFDNLLDRGDVGYLHMYVPDAYLL